MPADTPNDAERSETLPPETGTAPPIPIEAVARVLGANGDVRHVMTAAYAEDRAGVVIRSIQICADEPPLVSVAVRKGHTIEPVIRDSHAFAVCRISPEDRLLIKKFSQALPPDESDDPFVSIPCRALRTGAPVLDRSEMALDCEVVRHFDLEADCELYIGQVVAVRIPS